MTLQTRLKAAIEQVRDYATLTGHPLLAIGLAILLFILTEIYLLLYLTG